MTRPNKLGFLALAALAAVALAGCRSRSTVNGTFDRTFKVSGPVRLELTNGSGESRVTVGQAGEVRIHGEIRVRSWSQESSQRRIRELEANPPVAQDGALIRVGGVGGRVGNFVVDYVVQVPAETQIRAVNGSGDLDVNGIRGPANFTVGSGNITGSGIGGDVQVRAGSGEIQLSNIRGLVEATAGSGDVKLNSVHGEIRLQTGSGTIQIVQPGDAVAASTGSGRITINGASTDLRLSAASGDITVEGNPGSSNYWDFHTTSGNVALHVPQSASFRLYARTSSGEINAAIPIVMEGTTGKRELRARLGDGKARVEIATASGNIALH
ncbi:MAG: DUF4097 family beta strand repeat-containing protein [Candidatus Acidiferrales bacterium]